MFKFFKKRQEQRQAEEAKAKAFKQVLADMESGQGNALEASLMLYRATGDKESLSRFLMTFGGADVYILNNTAERIGDPVVTEASDGNGYLAAFSSEQRAASTATAANFTNKPALISALELVFTLGPSMGIVLNPGDPALEWNFTPEHVSNLRSLYEQAHQYTVGNLYSIWSGGAYRVVKLLAADEKGVHLRLYANTFAERPAKIDSSSLSLSASGEGFARAVGHMPIVRPSFLAMGSKRIATEPVTEEELDGYQMWAEAKGGYFGA